ncbi:hypothetical protein V8G54_017599 [Vigna mungo]|uniref:Secreted protein n=1 Tax=Vigna mungo TaxID=3915 RepID=A0AAQ3S2B3_VIGMU
MFYLFPLNDFHHWLFLFPLAFAAIGAGFEGKVEDGFGTAKPERGSVVGFGCFQSRFERPQPHPGATLVGVADLRRELPPRSLSNSSVVLFLFCGRLHHLSRNLTLSELDPLRLLRERDLQRRFSI